MARLEWDNVGERFFESGLDRGVLYLEDGTGVSWSGLVSINEQADGDQTEPFYIDGVKYYDNETIGDYLATLTAFTYPEEFEEYEGLVHIGNGIHVDDQIPKPFSLSYRSTIGSDLSGDAGHQIHLVYNVTAVPDTSTYTTMGEQAAAMTFGWQISAVPATLEGYRPTAHIIIDTRYTNRFLLRDLEAVLWGSETEDARIPTIAELVDIIEDWKMIRVVDHGDGTWSVTAPDELLTMLSPTQWQLTEATVLHQDEDSYTITSSTE